MKFYHAEKHNGYVREEVGGIFNKGFLKAYFGDLRHQKSESCGGGPYPETNHINTDRTTNYKLAISPAVFFNKLAHCRLLSVVCIYIYIYRSTISKPKSPTRCTLLNLCGTGKQSSDETMH